MTKAAAVKRVLITGAAGNLGQKLRHRLERQGGYELILLDRVNSPENSIFGVELSCVDESWNRHFEGVECVVHLAAEANPHASWRSLLINNTAVASNVFAAAVARGVHRVVFASSLHTMFGYEGKASCITPDMPPQPPNLYGMSKVVSEELAREYAQRRCISIICLRLGTVYKDDRRPRLGIDSVARQHRWLSNGDFCQACERAIAVDEIDFAVLHVTSRNAGSPWDLHATESMLGYRPQDGLIPQPPPWWRRMRNNLRRLRAPASEAWQYS